MLSWSGAVLSWSGLNKNSPILIARHDSTDLPQNVSAAVLPLFSTVCYHQSYQSMIAQAMGGTDVGCGEALPSTVVLGVSKAWKSMLPYPPLSPPPPTTRTL